MTDPQADRTICQQTAPDLCDPSGEVLVPGGERQRCEVWSRVMGYLRPIDSWNIGKRSEWHDRKPFRPRDQEEMAL